MTNKRAHKIIMLAANEFDVTQKDLRGRRRRRPLPWARMVACEAMRQAGMGYSEIGRALLLDHSSVIYLVKRCNELDWLQVAANRIFEESKE